MRLNSTSTPTEFPKGDDALFTLHCFYWIKTVSDEFIKKNTLLKMCVCFCQVLDAGLYL